MSLAVKLVLNYLQRIINSMWFFMHGALKYANCSMQLAYYTCSYMEQLAYYKMFVVYHHSIFFYFQTGVFVNKKCINRSHLHIYRTFSMCNFHYTFLEKYFACICVIEMHMHVRPLHHSTRFFASRRQKFMCGKVAYITNKSG